MFYEKNQEIFDDELYDMIKQIREGIEIHTNRGHTNYISKLTSFLSNYVRLISD